MAIRLTKRKLAALHSALSMDDVLYEQFRRLQEELNREAAKFARSQKVLSVYQRKGKFNIRMQILEVQKGPDGLVAIVK